MSDNGSITCTPQISGERAEHSGLMSDKWRVSCAKFPWMERIGKGGRGDSCGLGQASQLITVSVRASASVSEFLSFRVSVSWPIRSHKLNTHCNFLWAQRPRESKGTLWQLWAPFCPCAPHWFSARAKMMCKYANCVRLSLCLQTWPHVEFPRQRRLRVPPRGGALAFTWQQDVRASCPLPSALKHSEHSQSLALWLT